VAGAETAADGLDPGEVKLYSNGASIVLRNNGRVEISGNVYINGDIYRPCKC
jgi:phage gp45-like